MIFSVSASRISEIRCASAIAGARTNQAENPAATIEHMRFPSKSALPSLRRFPRYWPVLVLIGLALGLPGCGTGNLLGKGLGGDSFGGGAAIDEPRAALAAHDVLAANGTAAAAAFALAVTLPSSAGLGGGGSCLVWDKAQKTALLLDVVAPVGANVASPSLARLMYALHARYGRRPWSQLVAPAEALARFPQSISRAFARELAEAPAEIMARLAEQRLFQRAHDRPLGEGEPLAQVE